MGTRVDYNREKFKGRTCGGEQGVLRPVHQRRVDIALRMVEEELAARPNPLERPVRLLDIGCNDGSITKQFARLADELHGMDLEEENLEAAEAHDVKVRIADAEEEFPYENEFFDVVFAGELIEHLFDPEKFLARCHRILKPGGILVLTTPNLASLTNSYRLLLGWYPVLMSPFLSQGMGDHIHMFTVPKLREVLHIMNFDFTGAGSNCVLWRRSRFFLWLADKYPSLGDLLVVSARKSVPATS
jgi:2-polyprenyl-3-methyl-5-hydroxy-6-metoxy-1,4-benzoquinol methylase